MVLVMLPCFTEAAKRQRLHWHSIAISLPMIDAPSALLHVVLTLALTLLLPSHRLVVDSGLGANNA